MPFSARSGEVTQFSGFAIGAGPLWSPWTLVGQALVGRWALVGWALVGRALVGSLGPCWLGPCGPPGPLWAGPFGALLRPLGPGPRGPP